MQPACASPSRIGAGQRRAPGVRRRRRSRIARGCCTHARRAPTRCETRRAHAPPRAERRQRTRRHGVGHTVSCDTRGMSITARAPPRCWQSAAPMAVGAAEACGARMHTAVSAARALRRKGSPTALAARTRHGSSERWSPRSVAAGAVERHACGAVVACSVRTRRASAPSDGPPRGPCPRPAHSNAPACRRERTAAPRDAAPLFLPRPPPCHPKSCGARADSAPLDRESFCTAPRGLLFFQFVCSELGLQEARSSGFTCIPRISAHGTNAVTDTTSQVVCA